MKQLILFFSFLFSLSSFGQTTLFSETFESGNSLTLANGTQTNKWYRGTANQCNGTGALYISNNSNAYSYTNTATSVVHAYFNIVVPATATNITLTFNYKLAGESGWDDLKVFSFASSVAAPVAGTAVSTNANKVLLNTYHGTTTCTGASLSLGSIAGTTRKIVFQWRNDATGGVNPPALIDNITVTYTVANPPANDACSGATTLACATSNLAGTTVDCVSETPPASALTSNYGVWYKFTGDGQSTTISSTAVFDHEMVILTGTSCGSFAIVSSQDAALSNGTETYTFTSTNSQQYYIWIAHYSTTSTTTGTFTISRTCTSPPSNNNCSSAPALTINSGTSCGSSTNGTTIGANQSVTACAGTADDDVWYSFVANGTSQTITVTPGTMSDAVLQVFSGTCAGLTSLVCVDNTSGSSAETTTVTGLTNGVTYYVRVHSYGNGTGQGTFSICATTPCSTPTTAGTLSANKTSTVVNDGVVYTTTGNGGSITKLEWSYNNFTTVSGTVNNPANPYTLWMNVQQPTAYVRVTSVNGTCPAGVTNIVAVTLTSAPPYTYGTSAGDYISNVTLNTINNNSTYDTPQGYDSYQNFTATSTTLARGSTYTIYASSTMTYSNYSGYAAWIDYNGDGVFAVTENIMQQGPGATKSQSFTVPASTTPGSYRMRVLSSWLETPSTDAYYSTGYSWGEIEEYTINVTFGLPVEMMYFAGAPYGDRSNILVWKTSTEQNCSYFNLLHSEDGKQWNNIGSIEGANNSNTPIEYQLSHHNISPIVNYYKLQQYDFDGAYEMFGPISIDNTTVEKKIVKYLNLMGQEINFEQTKVTGVYIEVYSDGTSKKVYR